MSYFSLSAMVRILRDCGAKRASKDAKELFLEILIDHAKMIGFEAVKLAHLSGRTIIHEDDIRNAMSELFRLENEEED